jgi:small subunit ribosomal protein S18
MVRGANYGQLTGVCLRALPFNPGCEYRNNQFSVLLRFKMSSSSSQSSSTVRRAPTAKSRARKRSRIRSRTKKKDPLFVDGKRPRPMFVDYKDVELLRKLVNRHGRIVGRRKTGCSAVSQHAITAAIKRARFMALLPYVGE